MTYCGIKQLAKQLGIASYLERVGLAGPLAEGLRLFTSNSERDRWRTLKKDYQACKAQFQQIAQDAPPGNPNKVALMISSFQTVQGLKLEGILSLALRLQDFSPQLVDWGSGTWSRQYHKLFGNRNFLNFRRFVATQPPVIPDPKIVEFIHSQPTLGDLLGLTYQNVDIGRLVLSNVIYRHKFAKFDISQPDILAEVYSDLLQSQQNIMAAERMLEQVRPAIALVLEKGLSPAAEIFGVCLKRDIPVVQYLNSQDKNGFVLKRFTLENRHQHPFSLDASTWEQVKQMDWKPEREIELMQDFAQSYKSGTWFNRKFLHQGKQIKPAEAVRQQLDLDPAKKTAVIFSHVLWDATFFYGESIFDDYETWLLQTVRAACDNPRVNWVVKLHPDLVWKLKYEGYTGELRDTIAMRSEVGTLPSHVKLVMPDTDISTYSFFEITDYCLTVRGTIGIEMACYGVPVLTAGTGRYSNLGFTIDSTCAKEYLQRLAQIQDISPMTQKQVELARRFAYALFKLRPWQMRSFEMVYTPPQEAGQLDNNLVAHIDSYEQLAAASDMRELAEWVTSEQVDYLQLNAISDRREICAAS
ncbi:MAG: hypothetical protein AB4426_08020 [Xenococcaceae cyanobacterium]